jgi:hypothetical protein
MKAVLIIIVSAIPVLLAGCGSSGPKTIIEPTSQEVKSALFDLPLTFPAGIKISRLEVFPSLTGNDMKLEISGTQLDAEVILSIFSLPKNAPLPAKFKVPSKINKDYPWHFQITAEVQSDGRYVYKIHGTQYYN